MIKPITPDEVASVKRDTLPSFVIASFNKMIAAHWDGITSTFTQDEAVLEILKQVGSGDSEYERDIKRSEVFEQGWLDIESVYELAGWRVHYDKPGPGETYKANFTFRKKT